MKYLVLFQKAAGSTLTSSHRFSEDQEAEMKAFIDRKVMSGMTCHVYEHRNTFTLTKTVSAV